MFKGKSTIFTILAAVTLVIAVFAGIYASSIFGGDNYEIALPPVPSGEPDPGEQGNYRPVSDIPSLALITADNVQACIRDLERPSAFFQEFVVELFFEGGAGHSSVRRERYVMDGCERIYVYNSSGKISENFIITEDKTYIWDEGNRQYLTSPTGSILPDDVAQILTYESILDLDKGSITACGYAAVGETPCIFVEAYDSDLKAARNYWISLESGLLISANITKDEKLTYQMNQTAYGQNGVYETYFDLPDGNNVFYLDGGDPSQDAWE
ncbi:MAG: hypothetical protein LBL09_04730 [Oscillospiraceae bacterium]|jgi:hypothetical protein|nr:hypothetical protein [Oscillospiraceae bacterium]